MTARDTVRIDCTAHNHEPPFERKREGAGSIHDDSIAREQGFAGALVPGIVTTAYALPVLYQCWGDDWIDRGSVSARYRRPVFDGDTVAISFEFDSGDNGEHATFEAKRQDEACVVGEASLPVGRIQLDIDHLAGPALPAPDQPVLVERGKLRIGQELYSEPFELTPETLEALNRHIDLKPGDWPADRVHPFVYLLVAAMHQQVGTKFTSPGIHYAARLQMIEAAKCGDTLETTGKIVDVYERNGNHYFEAEQLIRTVEGRNVALSRNTVIYEIGGGSKQG